MSNSSLGDERAKVLAASLKGSCVTNIDLSYNEIGDEGAKALASGLKGSCVTNINLTGNNIGEEGMKALPNLEDVITLTTLSGIDSKLTSGF